MDFRLDGPMTEEEVIALKKRLAEACNIELDVIYEEWNWIDGDPNDDCELIREVEA